MNHNLALLSESEREDIELQKEAHLIVFKLRTGKYKRHDVSLLIERSNQPEQLRAYINKFRGFENER